MCEKCLQIIFSQAWTSVSLDFLLPPILQFNQSLKNQANKQ